MRNLSSNESWAEYRRQMLAETSRFIEWGLKHPELTIDIPVKPINQGSFPTGVAAWFWNTVLTTQVDNRIRKWRSMIMRWKK